jgi:hypothetical protein
MIISENNLITRAITHERCVTTRDTVKNNARAARGTTHTTARDTREQHDATQTMSRANNNK